MASTLFSIGHGNKTIQEFEDELQSFDIAYLVDVRTTPHSKWNPDFNRETLQNHLRGKHITYVYMGDVLGGMPSDRSCYTEEGRIDYAAISRKDFFIKGLERLLTADRKGIRLAIMCSEADPAMCHRSKLIGRALLEKGIILNHIVGINKSKSQYKVLSEINDGEQDTDLFGQTSAKSSYSRKSYPG
ncbi:MAG: DUF488 domain-containing protein [Prevotella sp.]|nr:DUF488 domain-containing protein [Prevotella sp.]